MNLEAIRSELFKLKVFFYHRLKRLFCKIAARSERAADYFSICPCCGRNVYTGAPCVGKESKK